MNIKFIQSTTKQIRPDKNLVILESTEIKYDVLIKKKSRLWISVERDMDVT
jgi:NADH dehydrogenase FAD-containing subunit